MKLIKVRITNFQSIQDSTEFDIDNFTCLVGKNEAGKTALLKALYRLNPINESDSKFNMINDYPRQTLTDYEATVATGGQPAEVVQAGYALDSEDIACLTEIIKPKFPVDEAAMLILRKGYSNKLNYTLEVDTKTPLGSLETSVSHSNDILEGYAEDTQKPFLDRIPKFLYFDEYYQMKGQDNIDLLMKRCENNQLQESDYPLLGLIDLAGLDLEEIINTTQTRDLITKLEAAGKTLTKEVLTYWSQNRHLRVTFDIRPAQSRDPRGMTTGMNLWCLVQDTKHAMSTGLENRSRGFVWFFSFLAWYQKLRKENENLILLLDEPGLFLHAKAQEDLLRYFEKNLTRDHQLIYTTHSPFMIDPRHFDRVRIVQNLSIEEASNNASNKQQGTKVVTEVLKAAPDTLFPLQGALGYEIYQTLFVGPNNLVVEGPSDLLYIQTMSALLQRKGKEGLSSNWTITPVGGADKVPTFVALIGANTKLNIAVLVDFQKKDSQKIDNLCKRELLKQNQVHTYAEFVEADEADVEDMFAPEFYLKLVNGEFETNLTIEDLEPGPPRIVSRLRNFFQNNPLADGTKFNHYRPALYLSQNIDLFEDDLTDLELEHFQAAFDVLNKLLEEPPFI